MINRQNTKACLSKEKEKGEVLTILVMEDYGKGNGCIIYKMAKGHISMLMEQLKMEYGDWEKE
jgi:hypothetical protein